MSIVSLLGINVLNNPAKFTDPYEFEITFECLEPLKNDLEWKLTYVGSSRSLEHDQELDSILVGPVPVGVNKFLFTADPPSPELIPASELVSVTVILLSCSYDGREFVRVGYYVNNEYDNEELRENPPAKVQVDQVVRNILAEKPRVTRFNIIWDNEQGEEYPPEQPELEEEEEDDEDEEQEEDDEDDNDIEEEDDEEEKAPGYESKEASESKDEKEEGPEAKKRKLKAEDEDEDEAEEIDLEEDDEEEEEEDGDAPEEDGEEEREGALEEERENTVETAPTPQDTSAAAAASDPEP
ncbi:Histone chaperone [Lachancea thermotolerans]|uniref:Histone chaperone n=1 Tax=Lachancea thermotolerans (strain ATCC 56472 / CBS 6340 / NRRL Y-8284) TaxID=559295 RepID=C5DKP5_LACTC|nr:KLTH0F06424p [Lachancea thermotolerans CBS 6340]CAR24046.1 KLTH0F06424p [Lachancea thermotolerans CBS 6340]